METYTIIAILALIIAIFGVTIVLIKLDKLQTPDNNNNDKLLLQYIEGLRKEIHENSRISRIEQGKKLEKIQENIQDGLKHSSATIQKQFKQSAEIIKDVTNQLSKLDSTNKQVLSFSQKMESLESILKNPKQRGVLGEYFLENMLSNVLQPNQYKMQYKFSNGEIVDAAIFFKENIIPIDAKFSLEKYNQIIEESDKIRCKKLKKEFKSDIKNRIDETSKYIRPNENTTNFAFMFIPAEGVYYSLLNYKVGEANAHSNDLIEYAFKKHVIIVSPTSFFAYLETVLQGLKALKIEESVKQIIKRIGDLSKHIDNYDSFMQKVGNHLGTTVNMYNNAYKEFKKIDKDIQKITNKESGGNIEPIFIDKPHKNEE